MIRSLIPALLMLMLVCPALSVADDDEVPTVERLEVTPGPNIFDDATRGAPVELASAEDAAAYFSGEQLAALNEQVDWETHCVLVFAWRGSGQDRMNAEVSEDGVLFVYSPGRTRDLRPHVYVYKLEQGVVWEVGGGPGPGPVRGR